MIVSYKDKDNDRLAPVKDEDTVWRNQTLQCL